MAGLPTFSWKEAVEVVEQKVPGGRYLVPTMGLLLTAVLVVWSVGFIYQRAVQPIALWAQQRGTQIDQFTALLVVVFLGFGGVAAVLVTMARRWRQWDDVMKRAIGAFVDGRIGPVESRLSHLEGNTASLESARRLEQRLRKIEPLPPEIVNMQNQEELRRAALLHLLTKAAEVKPPSGDN